MNRCCLPLLVVMVMWTERASAEPGTLPEDSLQPGSVEAPPAACLLTGDDFETRVAELELVLSERKELRELEDGFALRYPGTEAWAERLFRVVLEERRCCPFFTFELVFEPAAAGIWMQIRGSADAKLFLNEWINLEDEKSGSGG